MKSLTEQQLKDLLREAWEAGGSAFWDGIHRSDSPSNLHPQDLEQQEELLQKLIDGV